MTINLNLSKINIVELLRIQSKATSKFDLINFYGDNILKRKGNYIEIFSIDESDSITIIDNGEIPSDFIVQNGIELNDLKKYCPYIFYTSSISDLFSISFFSLNGENTTISIDLKNTSNQIDTKVSKVSDDYLMKNIKENKPFFAIKFKLKKNINYYEFLKKINQNFSYRYHKLLFDNYLKIIFTPERKILRPYDPLFNNFKSLKKSKTIQFRGNFHLDIRYIIIPKNISQDLVNKSCPSGQLESCSGIFIYNKDNILINRPHFYDFERLLNISQNLKNKNIKFIKIEINVLNNKVSNVEDILNLLKDLTVRKQIINMIETAAKDVPDQIKIITRSPLDEFNKIILSKYNSLLKQNKSKEECIEELNYMFGTSDQKKLIKELVNG